jgi:hypothetical protein
MSTKLKFVFGSLTGAFAVHVILSACGSGSGAGNGIANAQSPCAQWQYAVWPDPGAAAATTSAPHSVPAGWEPSGFTYAFGSGASVVALKRCAQ